MTTSLKFLLYIISTFLVTILLFPVVLISDIVNFFNREEEITERQFIADLFNP